MPLKEKPSAARHAGEVANGDSSPDAGRIEADSGLIPAVERRNGQGSGTRKERNANREAVLMFPIVFKLGNGDEPLAWTVQAAPEAPPVILERVTT